jgi:hypothetical protein
VKKKLILHIGVHKTGTSSIQSFLSENIDVFKRYGFYIPVPPNFIRGNPDLHHFFVGHIRSGSKETLINAIKHILEQSKGLDTILISSEMLVAKKTDLAYLKQMLMPFFNNIKVCLYIRRQDELYCSIYNQIVKANGITEKFDPTKVKFSKYYNYDALLQYLESIWGRKNLIIRPYNEKSFLNGNIIDDFCNYFLDIPVTSEFSMPTKRYNISFSPDVLEYCRLTNIIYERNEWGIISDLLTFYTNSKDYSKNKMQLMSSKQKEHILQAFYESNCAVAQKYFNDVNCKLFDNVDYSKSKVFKILRLREALAISSFIFKNNPDFFELILVDSNKIFKEPLNISAINYACSLKIIHLFKFMFNQKNVSNIVAKVEN